MTTDKAYDLPMASAKGGGGMIHPTLESPMLRIKYSNGALKNLIPFTDGINSTRIR